MKIIELYYYKRRCGGNPYPLELMLRIFILQNVYNLTDMAVMNEIIDSRAFSNFCAAVKLLFSSTFSHNCLAFYMSNFSQKFFDIQYEPKRIHHNQAINRRSKISIFLIFISFRTWLACSLIYKPYPFLYEIHKKFIIGKLQECAMCDKTKEKSFVFA